MSSRTKIALPVALVVVLLGGGVFWFLRDDAPEGVSLSTAVDGVESSANGAAAASGVAFDGTIAGEWTVDSTRGDFDFESATGTFAGFRLDEELASIGKTEAVGRTGDVTGSITIDGTTVTDGRFEVDMTSITTNDSRRDSAVQRAIEGDTFPTASFELQEPIDLGDGAEGGEAVQATAIGELTVRGVTKLVEVPLEARLVDGTIVVVGSTPITFSDFDVQVPSARIVVSAADNGVFEFQLLFTKAS